MRLAMLIAAACLGLAAIAHADGREGRVLNVPPISPLEATDAPAVTPASYQAPDHEFGIYRFGSTYSVTDGTSPAACEAACGEAQSCQSWSFVASYGAAPARCELKRGGGRAEKNQLAISGISPRLRTAMWGEAPPAPPEPAEPVVLPGQLIGGLGEAEAEAENEAGVEIAALKEAVDAVSAGAF